MLVLGKQAGTISTLYGVANCVKNRTRKNCVLQPISASRSLQCHPHLLLVNFENLVHCIFRNKYSTLEINVSHFGVLHWQQWQPPASTTDIIFTCEKIFSRHSLKKRDTSTILLFALANALYLLIYLFIVFIYSWLIYDL